MATSLKHVRSYWGVLALVGLLLSIHWLPIDGGGRVTAAAEQERSMRPLTSRPPADERFTFYLVATPESAMRKMATIDPAKEAVLLVESPSDQGRLDAFIFDVNGARSSAGIPPVTVIDLR